VVSKQLGGMIGKSDSKSWSARVIFENSHHQDAKHRSPVLPDHRNRKDPENMGLLSYISAPGGHNHQQLMLPFRRHNRQRHRFNVLPRFSCSAPSISVQANLLGIRLAQVRLPLLPPITAPLALVPQAPANIARLSVQGLRLQPPVLLRVICGAFAFRSVVPDDAADAMAFSVLSE
jgi:hypothetical protein